MVIGTVHGGELGIFLGVAKMTLVLRSCSYWEILLKNESAVFFTECMVGAAFCQKVFMNTEFWKVLEILAANLMLRCIVLIFRGTSTASLRMLIIGLARNAPIAILIAWWCIRSSFMRV